MYARLHPVPQSEERKGARKYGTFLSFPLASFRRMPDDKDETRTAISRRIGKRERKRTHESPSERRSEHEWEPERKAEAGEQGAGEQRV